MSHCHYCQNFRNTGSSGLKDISARVKQGDLVIVDGTEGQIFVNPEKETIEIYKILRGDCTKLKKDLNRSSSCQPRRWTVRQ
ncbi:hypothetical protein CEB3_c00780 [Peptococcaceae bacterium CEB3]|nr:hypothetical protein CEB3_c00780 [Peptococcaceae bacterium CEB3]